MKDIVKTYAKALHLALLEVNEDGQEIVLANFAKEITNNGHANLLSEIEKEFEVFVNQTKSRGVDKSENSEYLEKLNQFTKKSHNAWERAKKDGGIVFSYDEEK